MQKVYFVVVGKIKESFYREAVAEYVKRLSRFAKVEIKELPEGANPEAEADEILRACKGYTIALAVEGEKLSSEKLAKKMQTLADTLLRLSVEEIAAFPCMPKGRADVLAGGATLLAVLMKELGIETLVVSDEDNLEGYAVKKGLL